MTLDRNVCHWFRIHPSFLSSSPLLFSFSFILEKIRKFCLFVPLLLLSFLSKFFFFFFFLRFLLQNNFYERSKSKRVGERISREKSLKGIKLLTLPKSYGWLIWIIERGNVLKANLNHNDFGLNFFFRFIRFYSWTFKYVLCFIFNKGYTGSTEDKRYELTLNVRRRHNWMIEIFSVW